MDYQDSILPQANSNHALLNTRQSSASTLTGAPQTPKVLSRKILSLDGQLDGTVDDRVDDLFEKIGGCGLF